jgi:beta-phosphoglucomutase-like phosphatase (HAD superfamily)
VSITHIFFGLQHVLADSGQIRARYRLRLGEILAARYGGAAETWTQARIRIESDWDSYYADLDLGGDEGIEHFWEGQLRTTRALFRLTNTPEPDLTEMTSLSRQLPEMIMRGCDTLYPECREVLQHLIGEGFTLCLASQMMSSHAEAILYGGGVRAYFSVITGPDHVEYVDADAAFYECAVRRAQVSPENCLVVDYPARHLRAAEWAGMKTLRLCRDESYSIRDSDLKTVDELWGVVLYLRNNGA